MQTRGSLNSRKVRFLLGAPLIIAGIEAYYYLTQSVRCMWVLPIEAAIGSVYLGAVILGDVIDFGNGKRRKTIAEQAAAERAMSLARSLSAPAA